MPINPQLQTLLDSVPTVDLRTLTIAQIRGMNASSIPEGQPGPEAESTEDRRIDTPNGPLAARIHRPFGEGPFPTVVFIHGGGWVAGSPAVISPTTERMCRYLGAVVVSISYRLAPEHPFPAGFDDTLFLTQWAADHIDELGGRTDAFAISGESAGGNFAAAIAVAMRTDDILTGQLLFNPAVDLGPTRCDTDSYRADLDPALSAVNVDYSVRSYLGAEASTDWRASPIVAEDVAGLAPAVVGVSGYDPLRDQGLAYADKLKAAGVPVEVARFDDLVHAYAAQSPLIPVCNEALVQTCDQFRALMGWPAPDGDD